MVLRPVQACCRLSLLRRSPMLCYCRRKFFLVSVTMGDAMLAKLCLKINPDSLLLLLLICTEHRPLERRSKRTAGDLLCVREILSYRKLWCCQFPISCCSSDVADVGLKYMTPWPTLLYIMTPGWSWACHLCLHDVTISWGEWSLPAEQSAVTALKLTRY